MEKTVKIRAYPDNAKNGVSQGNLTEEQERALELAKKNALLEEVKAELLGHLKTIEQLRENLRQEQVKSAGLAKQASGMDAHDIAVKDAQLEEEKSRSLENLKTIVQLRESLKQEQAKSSELANKTLELETRVRDALALESNELARIKTQLEEEKRKSLEQFKTIEQLKESLQQAQAKAAAVTGNTAELETKVKGLTEALANISSIAESVKPK